jgi:hypothetical protein
MGDFQTHVWRLVISNLETSFKKVEKYAQQGKYFDTPFLIIKDWL